MSQSTQELSYGTPKKRKKQHKSSPSRKMHRFSIKSYKGFNKPDTVHIFTRCVSLVINLNSTGFQFGAGNSPYAAMFLAGDVITIQSGVNATSVLIPNYTDFTSLFDELMVHKWEIKMTPTNAAISGTGNPGCSILGSCIDYNDKVAPTSVGDIQQYPSYRSVLLNADRPTSTIVVYPKMQTYAVDSAGNANNGITKRGYFKSTIQIDHYGVKYAFVQVPPGGAVTLVFEMKITYKCRGVK